MGEKIFQQSLNNHPGSQNAALKMVKNKIENTKEYNGKLDASAIKFIKESIDKNQENLGLYIGDLVYKNNDTVVLKIN